MIGCLPFGRELVDRAVGGAGLESATDEGLYQTSPALG
jgi:hypothetical protein